MKTGIVTLIGNPNVGKSTIFNLLSEKKISIVTHKPQTTRDSIFNIINGNNYRIFLQDVPGFIKNIKNNLDKKMVSVVKSAFKKSNLNILVINESDLDQSDNFFLKNRNNLKLDIVILNKIDLIKIEHAGQIREKIRQNFPNIDFVEMSAIQSFNKDLLLETIIRKLPDENFYDDGNYFLKKDDFFCKEIIREKIFLILKQEIPYNSAVEIENINQKNNVVFISAKIAVPRESHKKIIIGSGGKNIKKIRKSSEKELKIFFKKKVKLELFVKVENWLKSDYILKKYGY